MGDYGGPLYGLLRGILGAVWTMAHRVTLGAKCMPDPHTTSHLYMAFTHLSISSGAHSGPHFESIKLKLDDFTN